MKKAFSLLELVLALALLSLMVSLLLPSLGHLHKQSRALQAREERDKKAVEMMERAMVHQEEAPEEGFSLRVSPYSQNLERVEVFYEDDKILEGLRPPRGFFSP
ncbi:MAG: prepilin-type N-terminal cleavage/methylation domain-containing protein [Tissierellia bacterium]|nr:prepilin-type N-terminal cleavage/methylation domain-containing protein [Tissierellia bacterium]